MGLVFSNFGTATIASAPSGTGGLSFSVTAGQGARFPNLVAGDYFYGIFKDSSGNREIVKIEARSTDAMTIAANGRGLDGTTARTWAAGDHFVLGMTKIALDEIFNANLVALGALASAADKVPYFTGSGAAALATVTSFIRTLLDDADSATARATLGALASSAVSAFGLTLIDDADAATARITLGAAALASPAFTGTPTAPTAAAGTSTTQIATTAFVMGQTANTSRSGIAELATDAEAQAGTDAARCITPDNLGATVIGMGQTYQDMTASRASGVTYTNSTGRTILVSAWGTAGGIANPRAQCYVDGAMIADNSWYANGAGYTASGYFLVPPGSTYQITFTNTSGTFTKWFELR
jgi:hypothetical protein